MGLDMYLERRTYVKNWSHQKPEEKHEISIKKNGKEVDYIKNERISYIIEQIGYWRKANMIHNWFVENVQDGQDDCKEYEVYDDKLKELKEICQKVIESLENSQTKKIKIKTGYSGVTQSDIFEEIDVFTDTKLAEELLPTQSGFFFGGTEYDKYYLDDLKETIKIIDTALENSKGDYYYSSSW